ncbi:MAG: serine/threonine-protein kinase [Gemmatimonadaceae bacterium]|nr:serine/threonine-protein kinase [Gemmatimonadaceae bacterium]
MDDQRSTGARARYERATALFDAALDLPEREREDFITGSTANEPALAADVRSLLQAHAQLGGFLELSPVHDAELRLMQEVLADRYVLRERIASGRMASVYRADDLRHQRQVAVKVLSDSTPPLATTSAHQQRFLDEIRVTAGLQHPNLMPVFDSGAAVGLFFYVMPFVDGETLRQRLRRTGPLSLDAAMRVVRGVAGALEHAHGRGIVHRDLKPENILLRDEQPIVCDFGIALATAALDTGRLTESGVMIGTPQYMSPEQASGAALIDARTDVYALAVILYEMLVGDPPHLASTSQGVLAKVRAEKPTSVHSLRDGIPRAVSQVIERALAKQPADRFPSASGFVSALDDASNDALSVPVASTPRAHRALRVGAIAVATAGVLAAAAMFATRRDAAPSPSGAPPSRFVITPIADAAIGRAPTITPDGSAIVYAGSAASGRQLYVRRVNELEARAISGPKGALTTWVSPDGTRIAFTTSDDRLTVIGIDGRNMHDVAGVFRYSDAAWMNDSVLVFDSFGQLGLSWISAAGGTPLPLTRLDTLRHDTVHQTPLAIGDGRSIVFVAARNRAGPGAQIGDLSLVRFEPGATQPIAYTPLGLHASQPFAFVDGWLLYVSADGRTVMAAQLDVATGVVSGTPIPVLEQEGGGIERVRLASNGTLLYTRRVQPKNAPVLVDSAGVATPVIKGLSGGFMNPRVSPDGRRIVVQGATQDGNDAFVFDLATGTQTRLTHAGNVLGPAWRADGQRLVYASTRDGQDAIWSSVANGDGNATRIAAVPGAFAASPARAGDVVLFQRRTRGVWSIWQAPPAAGLPAIPIVEGGFDAFMPSLSPDGRWLAYASSESGRYEIHLRPFPGPGAAMQVSRDGGTEPLWSPDGRHIFYRANRKMIAAAITRGAAPTVSGRRALFTDVFDGDMPMPHRNYDVTPDGRNFVMIAAVDDMVPETIVVLNWLTELRTKTAAVGKR